MYLGRKLDVAGVAQDPSLGWQRCKTRSPEDIVFFSKSVNDVKGTTLTFVPSLMCCIKAVAHMISLHSTRIAIKPWPRTTSKVGNSNLQITDIYIYIDRLYRYITWEKLQEAIELIGGSSPLPQWVKMPWESVDGALRPASVCGRCLTEHLKVEVWSFFAGYLRLQR